MDWEKARTVGHNMLEGVGIVFMMHQQTGDIALHLRRAMTDAEIKRLPRRNPLSRVS